jgi:hypothetical protein
VVTIGLPVARNGLISKHESDLMGDKIEGFAHLGAVEVGAIGGGAGFGVLSKVYGHRKTQADSKQIQRRSESGRDRKSLKH